MTFFTSQPLWFERKAKRRPLERAAGPMLSDPNLRRVRRMARSWDAGALGACAGGYVFDKDRVGSARPVAIDTVASCSITVSGG